MPYKQKVADTNEPAQSQAIKLKKSLWGWNCEFEARMATDVRSDLINERKISLSRKKKNQKN